MKTANNREQILWHLQNNLHEPLKPETIEKILNDCDRFNAGLITLETIIGNGKQGVSFAQMCEDLQIELTDGTEPTLTEQLTQLWLTWYPNQPPTPEQIQALKGDSEKLLTYLDIKPNTFLFKDKSGRGFKSKLTHTHILANFDEDDLQEYDDSDRTLEQFICTSEFGDVWQVANKSIENLGY